MATCVGEPVSWLRLERHALGELEGEERAAVEAHLGACPACRACRDRLEQPLPLPALPPVRSPWARLVAWTARRWTPLAVAAAAAGALVATLGAPGDQVRAKGGDVTLELVREHDGVVDADPGAFLPGDRWKALVTCPPGRRHAIELAVFQDHEWSAPLAPATIACGNAVPLPGAFRLGAGGDARVCLFVDSPPHTDPDAIPSTCLTVRAAPVE